MRRQRHRRVRRGLRAREAVAGKPQVIVANTVPGKGVSYMEGDYTWHGKPPNAEQADDALRELQADSAKGFSPMPSAGTGDRRRARDASAWTIATPPRSSKCRRATASAKG